MKLTELQFEIPNIDDSKLCQARNILGETGKLYNDDELNNLITNFEFLIESWLDLFEKQTYDGKTLAELLRNK